MTTIFISLSKNVIDNVKAECQKLARQFENAEVKDWINSVFKNWVVNDGPSALVESLDASAPGWARKAHGAGDLYKIDWAECSHMLQPVVDYLEHTLANGGNIRAIAVPDAIQRSEAWHAELAANMGNESTTVEDGIETLLKLEEGYSWVRVFGKSSLDREGEIMGHCVGSYYDEVSRGNKTIYSLRDPKGGPHITVEVVKRSVNQIKGKANKTVVVKYRPYILPLMSLLAPTVDQICTDESGIEIPDFQAHLKKEKLLRTYSSPLQPSVKVAHKKIEYEFRIGTDKKGAMLPEIVEYARLGKSNNLVCRDSTGKSTIFKESEEDFQKVLQKCGLGDLKALDRAVLFQKLVQDFKSLTHVLPPTYPHLECLLAVSKVNATVQNFHLVTPLKGFEDTLGALLGFRNPILCAVVNSKATQSMFNDDHVDDVVPASIGDELYIPTKFLKWGRSASYSDLKAVETFLSSHIPLTGRHSAGIRFELRSKMQPLLRGPDSYASPIIHAASLEHATLEIHPFFDNRVLDVKRRSLAAGTAIEDLTLEDQLSYLESHFKISTKQIGTSDGFFTFFAVALLWDKEAAVQFILRHPNFLRHLEFLLSAPALKSTKRFQEMTASTQKDMESSRKTLGKKLSRLLTLVPEERVQMAQKLGASYRATFAKIWK